jgi:tRNA dimethylallyltransferase
MDIGTAKPSDEERIRIPHHLLDLVDPDQTYSVADFKAQALVAIEDISLRGKLPILVGGTGLYIDAVLFDFGFGPSADLESRKYLETKTVEELQELIRNKSYPMPENNKNKRYLIRALERKGSIGTKSQGRPNTLVIGLSVESDELRRRIENRVEAMLQAGFVDEYRRLLERYSEDAAGFRAPGYKAFLPYLRGETSLEQARAEFVRNDWRLAKRQRTWFKRNKTIQWLTDRSNAVDIVTSFLNK